MATPSPPAEKVVAKVQNVDDILSRSKDCNVHQITVYSIASFILLFLSYQHGLVFFTGNSPAWQCVENSTSRFCQSYHNQTFTVTGSLFNKRCELNRSEWTFVTEKDYSFVTEFDLVCARSSVVALVGASFFCGCVLGALICGPIADAVGRKLTIVAFLVLVFSSGLTLRYMGSVWHFYPLQFVGGVGLSGAMYPIMVYLSEVSPPQHRALVMNASNVFCSLSFTVMDLTAWYLQSWRLLYLYLVLPLLPLVPIFVFVLPESPRWLASKKKHEQVREALAWLNTETNVEDAQPQPSPDEQPSVDSAKQLYTYWDLIRDKRILVLTLRISFLWTAMAILYYTIAAQSLGYGGSMYFNYLVASLADIPAFFTATYFTNKVGRRITCMVGCFGAGLLIGLVPLVPHTFTHHHTAILLLTVFARLFCYTAFDGIYVWTPEIFPTVVRAQGMAVCGVFEKIGLITVPFVCSILQDVSYYLPFALMAVLGVLGCLIVAPLPETAHRPTREHFEDFFSQPVAASVDDKYIGAEIGRDNFAAK